MTRLLVVDDSALMRRLLTNLFVQAGFEVATARDGDEAIRQLHEIKPDVVTLDIQMPRMDGLACLDRIMLERPTPCVMVSSLTDDGASETLDALDLGAVDFLAKPGGAISLTFDSVAEQLVEKIRSAAAAKLPSTARLAERVRLRTGRSDAPRPPPAPGAAIPEWRGQSQATLVLVGASTGGPPALEALLSAVPASFPWPIVIAQHMPKVFTGQLARRLDRSCAITVSEVNRPTVLSGGQAYIARGDADVLVTRRGGQLSVVTAPESADFLWHPSVERLVSSALLHVAPENIVAVLMTGMGSDGADAMTAVHEGGGFTIAEAESTAVVWGMPGALVQRGGASLVLPLDAIGGTLVSLAARA